MSWTAFHRRAETLRAVIDEADLRRDGTLPMQLPGVPDTFHDELDLAGALALRWSTVLHATIERELADRFEHDADDRESAVRRAWAGTARALPGIRAILDRQLVTPEVPEIGLALDRARTKEHALLAEAAGLGGGADAGDRLERAARASYRPSIPLPEVVTEIPADAASSRALAPRGSAAFVARLKAALAA